MDPSPRIAFDLHDPAIIADPHPTYARMRKEQPLWLNPVSNTWVATRYADVSMLLHSSSATNHRIDHLLDRLPPAERERAAPLHHILASRLVFTEGADHARIRGLLMQGFAPHHVASYADVVSTCLGRLLHELPTDEPVDLVERLTNLLPGIVILSVLGIPVSEQPQMKRWTDDVYAWIGHWPSSIVERTRHALDAVAGLERRLGELIAAARRAPGPGMLSALVHAQDEGRILDTRELVANVIGLVNAGQETTTCLLANGLLHLLRHPEQMERLRGDPALLPSAVEEMLRYDAPAQFIARRIERPIELRGVRLDAGSIVSLGLAAANRDEAAFDDPDRFDVARSPNLHLSFGHGMHYCVGSALARLEARQMFGELLRRFRTIELACPWEDLRWRPTTTFRSPLSLPVVLRR